MAVRVLRGQEIAITKNNPGIKKIRVKLGWDFHSVKNKSLDLDSSLFLCNNKGVALSSKHFIFYNNLEDPYGAVFHLGDCKTGRDGEEEIIIELHKFPAEVEKIVFAASIYDGEKNNNYFGQVQCSYLKIIDDSTQEEMMRFDLKESFSSETAIILGHMYRDGEEWFFKTDGRGFKDGLRGIVLHHGLI